MEKDDGVRTWRSKEPGKDGDEGVRAGRWLESRLILTKTNTITAYPVSLRSCSRPFSSALVPNLHAYPASPSGLHAVGWREDGKGKY